MRVSLWALAIVFSTSLSSVAQQSTTLQAAEDHIVLDVVVTNKAGKPVSGLDQQGFVVTDNKKPSEVRSFRASCGPVPSAEPVKIILLIDEVNTNFSSVAYERNAIKTYLKSNGGRLAYPVSLIFFSDTGSEMSNGASRDGNALAAALEDHDTKLRTIRRSNGFYGAVDRFQLSLQNLRSIVAKEQAEPGRKLLLWVSPGWPYLSGVNVQLTAKEEQSIFDSIVSLSSSMRRAKITLSSIDPLGTADSVTLRTTFWEEFQKGVSAPKNAQAGDLSLQVLSYETGGQVANSNNDVAMLIAKAASDADCYYELTLDVPPAEHTNEYHALAVKMEASGLTARTRTGYYAQP